ncbi:MAG: LON peptidase substrate-binding domain-containing protein [Deltaproteobacteria bacterium]|nr:LON peptidase substrate-binding domain-containing protein [Deltaproteobacteria bacterium]MBI3389111.1 LON peptidase substrate-binding domain-containing protein [Deltaproteobacteria bacterium]
MDLPRLIPIFPLPNVVLFPGVPLPLHIFEPRYREMVRDARVSDQVIGMTLLRGDWQKDYHGTPPIFLTGCAGRMVSAEALPDGRFNILLHGIREFSIVRETGDKMYRQAEIVWRPSVLGATIGSERRRYLSTLLDRFLMSQPETPARKLLRDPSLSDELLVNFFCYALELAPLEKQGLLEMTSLDARAGALGEVLEFRLEELRLAGRAPLGNDRCH